MVYWVMLKEANNCPVSGLCQTSPSVSLSLSYHLNTSVLPGLVLSVLNVIVSLTAFVVLSVILTFFTL